MLKKFLTFFVQNNAQRGLAFLLLMPLGVSSTVYAEARRAFVVGIDQYENFSKERQLDNAVSDAQAIGEKLATIDFAHVTIKHNPGRFEFNTAWQEFLDSIEPGDTVTFFFSGHGVAIDGKNYLLPRSMPNLQPGRSELIKSESLSLNNLMLDIQKRNPAVTLMILDACRNDPFISGKLRDASTTGGLAGSNDPPSGTFIMYSAAAGMVALDSVPGEQQPHSVYTRHLLDLIPRNDLDIAAMARELRQRVNETTRASADGFLQSPAYYDGLVGDFCLPGCDAGMSVSEQAVTANNNKASQKPETNTQGNSNNNSNSSVVPRDAVADIAEVQVAAVKKTDDQALRSVPKLEEVSKKDRRAASAARKKGESLYWKDTEKALSAYRRATELDPTNAEGWAYLGDLYQRGNNFDDALRAYEQALFISEAKISDDWKSIALAGIGSVHQTQGEFEQAVDFYNQALELESDKERVANLHSSLGAVHMIRGGYIEAEEQYLISLELFQQLKIKEDIAGQYGRLGVVYRQYGNFEKSEEYHLRALKIQKKLKVPDRVAGQYAGLALLYRDRGDIEKSEEFHLKAIKIFEKLDDEASVANQLGFLGTLYEENDNLDKAEEAHLKSLGIFESLGYTGDVAYQYANLGYVYLGRDDLTKSEEYQLKALEIYKSLNRKDGMAEALGHIGKLYELRGDVDAAREYWQQGRALYEELGLQRKANKFSAWLTELN